jgi:2-(1,2-epoxy-1,2-dihydrophenyl)acetyl-CoA isomerase
MPSILFEIKDQLAIIRLNRPDKLNAFNREMGLSLLDRLSECSVSLEIRAVYITGMGKGFSAGQDLAEVTESGGPVAQAVAAMLSDVYNPIVIRIRDLNIPVLAAVNGVAAGAGANIALCCDIVVASSSASFIQAFSKIGLIPDSGGTFFLPRLIGWQKASALSMLGERLSAKEAEQCGMIYKVFADEDFEKASLEMARTLAKMPTTALSLIKQALNNSLSNNLGAQLSLESELQQKASGTLDYKEGIQAFLEKRKPGFRGN